MTQNEIEINRPNSLPYPNIFIYDGALVQNNNNIIIYLYPLGLNVKRLSESLNFFYNFLKK